MRIPIGNHEQIFQHLLSFLLDKVKLKAAFFGIVNDLKILVSLLLIFV